MIEGQGELNRRSLFFMEDDQRKSLRNIITREMIANTLIHREYTSPYQAKFVIEKDRMYVENANRASQDAVITPDNMEPFPKNPIIAAFFRNIGYADIEEKSVNLELLKKEGKSKGTYYVLQNKGE